MRIGALITNYKTWPLTLNAVKKLYEHSGGAHDELIILDDASGEAVPALPDGVRVVANERNLGYVSSINIGFLALSSDVVVVLDSDAYPTTDLVAQARAAFSSRPRLGQLGIRLHNGRGAVGGWERAPSALGLLAGQALEQRLTRAGDWRRPLVVHSCGMVVRRSAFQQVGGFDEGFDFLDADVDFSLRLREAGWEVEISEDMQGVHVGSGSPQKTSTRVVRHHRNRWRLLQKHGMLPRGWKRQGFKVGLAIRHAVELYILLAMGRRFVSDADTLMGKVQGRRELLRGVWTGYGNE